MQLSELSAQTGVPIATIKFYLRERLLMPGAAVSSTRARYGDEHVARIRLIRALTDVGGLTVQKTREVLELVQSPAADVFSSLGRAISALPPYFERVGSEGADFPRARAALASLGRVYEPRFLAVAQLERALAAAEDAGLPLDDAKLAAYARGIDVIAAADLDGMPTQGGGALEYAVLGTVIYEPVLLALRKLAHQHGMAAALAAEGTAATADN